MFSDCKVALHEKHWQQKLHRLTRSVIKPFLFKFSFHLLFDLRLHLNLHTEWERLFASTSTVKMVQKSENKINNAWICKLLKVSGRTENSSASRSRVVIRFASYSRHFPFTTAKSSHAQWEQRCKKFPKIRMRKTRECHQSLRRRHTRSFSVPSTILNSLTKSLSRSGLVCTSSAATSVEAIFPEWKKLFIFWPKVRIIN